MNEACEGSSPSARRMTDTAWIRLSSVTATSCQTAMISSVDEPVPVRDEVGERTERASGR